MVVAVRGLVLILADAAARMVRAERCVGVLLTGMALTVGGFASMQRRWLPMDHADAGHRAADRRGLPGRLGSRRSRAGRALREH